MKNTLKVYEYKNCGTCKKAISFLDKKGIKYEKVPIRENPPTQAELKEMLKVVGSSKKLFNTSGGDYKEMGLKDKLDSMPLEEQLKLLAGNGNLVKRPFVLGKGIALVGFKEEEWEEKI